jgi:SAM-dependent methyltransferase
MANSEHQLHLGEINILTKKKNNEKFDSCLLLDVLEHIENDGNFIKEIKKLLKINGQLVLSVPAHQFLFSPADEKSGHFRRYNYRDLEKKLVDSGFEIVWSSSFTILLLPLLILSRLYSRYKEQYNIDSEHSSLVNRILCTFIPLETILFRTGFFRFGASIFLVARISNNSH